jgi:RES domain-containing protein
MTFGLSGGNYSDDLVTLLIPSGVNYEQNNLAINQANRLPAFFSLEDHFEFSHQVRIAE